MLPSTATWSKAWNLVGSCRRFTTSTPSMLTSSPRTANSLLHRSTLTSCLQTILLQRSQGTASSLQLESPQRQQQQHVPPPPPGLPRECSLKSWATSHQRPQCLLRMQTHTRVSVSPRLRPYSNSKDTCHHRISSSLRDTNRRATNPPPSRPSPVLLDRHRWVDRRATPLLLYLRRLKRRTCKIGTMSP
jgi:hypothetical protein